MNYKIALSNKKYNMHTGQDTRNFTIKKTEDVVKLRFDEENQVFYAKIESPSQHTRYLFQQRRLAISLSKLNTGRSQRIHMGNSYWPGDMYWNEQSHQWEAQAMFYVKKKYHPRWSRCGYTGVVVHNAVSSLDDEIEIPFNASNLKPNQKRTLKGQWTNWYNSVKAVLVSCPTVFMTSQLDIHYGNRCRAYKTMSNRIKIEYDSENDIIINRKDHPPKNADPYELSATVNQNGREVTFNVTSMGSRVLEAFMNNELWVGLDLQDISYATNHGGSSKRAHSGDHWREEGPETTSYYNRRYEYRLQDKWYCAESMRKPIYYQGSNTLTITYTIPVAIDYTLLKHSGIYNLIKLMQKHNDVEELDLIHRTPRIVIGEFSTGRRLFKYNPNVVVNFI